MKKGDKVNYAKKGDYVLVYYKGMLEDGTVFDQNLTGGEFTLIYNMDPERFPRTVNFSVFNWKKKLLHFFYSQ